MIYATHNCPAAFNTYIPYFYRKILMKPTIALQHSIPAWAMLSPCKTF